MSKNMEIISNGHNITAEVTDFLVALTERFGSVEAGSAAFIAWRKTTSSDVRGE